MPTKRVSAHRKKLLRKSKAELFSALGFDMVNMAFEVKMSTEKIGIGFRRGKLEVVAATDERKNGYTVWRCRCDCGGEALLDTRCLQRGTVRDCGCETRLRPGQKDISGMRFGKLTAVEPSPVQPPGRTMWRCRCDCGGEIDAPLSQLTSGYRKSCGCLSHPPLKEFVGMRFGRLVVTTYAGKRGGMHRWRCRCDCGKDTVVGQTLLQTGKTKSCGCLGASRYKENLKLCLGTSVALLEGLQNHLNSRNTSGCTGVYWSSSAQRWNAQITFQSKTYFLGSFTNKEDAISARRNGERMHTDFLTWYYSTQKAAPEHK